MFAFIRSRLANNIIIFIVGMGLAYSFSMFFGNNGFITANIGDAFKEAQSQNNYHVLVTTNDNRYSIQSLKEFTQSPGKSLRITMIYNKDIKEKLISALQSPFQFSVGESDDELIILFDLSQQTIPYGKNLLEISLDNINDKNIPIIHSITFYDQDVINDLSINYDNVSEYH